MYYDRFLSISVYYIYYILYNYLSFKQDDAMNFLQQIKYTILFY